MSKIPDSICAIPWLNLNIDTKGNISPCCLSTDIDLGNIENISLTDAFNSSRLNNLRNQFLEGIKPVECNNCWRLEEQGVTSIRMHNIQRFQEDFIKFIDKPTITTLDIKFNNTCNFKCRICSGESSSLMAQEEQQYRGWPIKKQKQWSEDPKFLNDIIKLLPDLKNLHMYGGEPFLIKKFSKVLEKAVEGGYAENINLHYNSNGSIWPKEFLPLWPYFKSVNILFSIDDIGRRFELQRGGNWSAVEKNILDLKNFGLKNLCIDIMPTISIMNIYYLDQLYDWTSVHGLQLVVNYVRHEDFEFSGITERAKQAIIDKYKNHPWKEMSMIMEIINKTPASDGRRFLEATGFFDKIRNEDFSDSHREIAELMGYRKN